MAPEPKTIQRVDPSSFYIPITKLQGAQALMGGIPRGTITAALGAPGACKSTLFAHCCVEVAIAEKGNIMVVDTENKYHVFLDLASVLSERYGIPINPVRVRCLVEKTGGAKDPKYEVSWEMEDDVDPKAMNMFILHCPDITDLTTMFGRGVDLKIYESGKFKIVMRPGAWSDTIQEAPISEFIKKYKCKVMLIDSVTNPLDEIPAVGENFPARTDLTQVWLLQVHKVAAATGMPVLATFHETRNETSPFSKDLDIEGGKAVKYNLAFIAYMLKENELGLLPKGAAKPKTLARDERAMFIARHGSTSVVPWAEFRYFKITKQGLRDEDDDGSEESTVPDAA